MHILFVYHQSYVYFQTTIMFTQLGQRDLILEKISDCLSRQTGPGRLRLDSQVSLASDKESSTPEGTVKSHDFCQWSAPTLR